MLVIMIILCELFFWVLIAAGLITRYLLKQQTLSLVLLAMTPVIDLALLAVTALDLKNGTAPTMAHGLAAVYIGVSVSCGKSMIAWADRHFAAKFCSSAVSPVPNKYGKEHAAQERKGWVKHLLAFTIGTILLLGMTVLIGETAQISVFIRIIKMWAVLLLIDFIVSFSYTVWPRKEREEAINHAQNRRL